MVWKKRYRGALLDAPRFNGYKRVMPRDPNELAKYRAALDALQVAVAHGGDASDAADIDKAAAALGRMCRRREEGQAARSEVAPAPAPPPAAAVAPGSKAYAGLSLSEAAAKYLLSAGSAQRASKIIEALTAGGLEMSSEQPVSSLKAALQRRSQNFGDVHLVAYGTWTHRDNLTDKERAALDHKERTKRGLSAARERGKQIGQRLRFTPEIEAEVEKLIEQGCKMKDIAKKYGFATNTIRLRFTAERRREIRDRAKGTKDRPSLRVVGGTVDATA